MLGSHQAEFYHERRPEVVIHQHRIRPYFLNPFDLSIAFRPPLNPATSGGTALPRPSAIIVVTGCPSCCPSA